MERTPVKSSQIVSVGHDPEKDILEIEFRGGGVYQYPNFPAEKHAEMMASDSVGKYFHANIRSNPKHPHMKLEASGEGKEVKA
jgi:hypothetical protein